MNKYIFTYPFRYRRNFGSKAANIMFLSENNFSVPCFYLCAYNAHVIYKSGNKAVVQEIRSELKSLISEDKNYIVRSSANIEDNAVCSFAGQFMSIADLRGLDRIVEAIVEIWISADAPNVKSYLSDKGLHDNGIKMGVIIQEMIPADYSGIAFSKNPITGLSEIIIEAGSGPGSLLMHQGYDPLRWVSKWGNFISRPENPAISEELIQEISEKTSEIATAYKKAVDIEWIYDGKKLWFVQVRPITTIDIPVYSNKISKEMLPGIIKPLVYSINTPLINGIWVRILRRLTGEKSILPENLTGHFYYRAYFNMSAFGRIFERLGMPYESLELLMGIEAEGPKKPRMKPGMRSLIVLPRIALFLISLAGLEHRFRHQTKKKHIKFRSLADEIKAESDPRKLLMIKNKLSGDMEATAYLNILIPMMAMLYTKVLSSMLKKEGVDFNDLDMSGITKVSREFSPHHSLSMLHEKYFSQTGDLNKESRENFDADIKSFIEKFGHFSDSGNDFSSKPWRETPELISSMIKNTVSEKKSDTKILFKAIKIKFPKKIIISHVYRKATVFAVFRDEISSLYTYGYGQYRNIFLGIAEALINTGIIDEKDDIFYLTSDELQKIIAGENNRGIRETIISRKYMIEECSDINLPDNIFGNIQPAIDKSSGTSYTGTATSPGTYTGPVKVLKGLSEFEKLNEGDVLVIPYSDAGWTPLFSKAGAVIAESGGMLSHSSIVAREYGIPAVVSVKDACRIPDNTIVKVNGFLGKITIMEEL